MRVTIIVPVLNEEQQITALLAHLLRMVTNRCEVLLVDGGSTDDTLQVIAQWPFRCLHAPHGRAVQMNLGAEKAQGDVLLFLHADTRLPPDWLEQISTAVASGHVWGRFDVRIEGRHWMLGLVSALMNLRSRLTGIATGSQAIFVECKAFASVGGYPEQPLLEDIALSGKLRALQRPACLRSKVSISGRRWEQRGVWTTIFLMWRLRWAYWRGVPAAELAARYPM